MSSDGVERTFTSSLPGEEEMSEEVMDDSNAVTSTKMSTKDTFVDPTKDDDDDESSTEQEETREFLSIFGPAYASTTQFWMGILYSSVPQGGFLALVALGFFNLYTVLAQHTWLSDDYHHSLQFIPKDSPLALLLAGEEGIIEGGEGEETHFEEGHDPVDMFRLGNGEWWYVGMLAGAGLAVGLVKVIWTLLVPERHAFPRKVPGFLDDIRGLHAHDIYLPLPILICSALSIGLGASVGPEAAMGATGTALGTFLSKRWRIGKFRAAPSINKNEGDQQETADETNQQEEESSYQVTKLLPDFSQDEKYIVMDGIAGAFGALLPAQYLSPMLIFELGNHWGENSTLSATETLARTGISASVAYIVFTSIEKYTILSQIQLPQAAYDLLPEIDVVNMFEGMILGIICGVVGFAGLIILILGNVLGDKTHDALDALGEKMGLHKRRISLGLLLTPVVGGTLVGLLCVVSPLCLSDGADQLSSVVTLGKALGSGTIAATAAIKFLCLSFSVPFGFVGGPIFPFLFVGACVGTVATLIVPGLPILVAVPCCIVAVPCAFIPAIFTFTTLISMMLALGGAATSPVFIACVCSYTTICGLGVLHRLFDDLRAAKKAAKQEAAAGGEEQA